MIQTLRHSLFLTSTVALIFGFGLPNVETGGASAVAAEPIVYTLRFSEAKNHYIDIEARFPGSDRPETELMMAAWTPGSYLVRGICQAHRIAGCRRYEPQSIAARQDKKEPLGNQVTHEPADYRPLPFILP